MNFSTLQWISLSLEVRVPFPLKLTYIDMLTKKKIMFLGGFLLDCASSYMNSYRNGKSVSELITILLHITTLRFLSFLSALPCRHKKSGTSERDILPAFMPVQVTDRLYLGFCLLWLPLEIPISHLSDEAVEEDKHFTLFSLQDSDVTLWLQQWHALFLYFAHNLMDIFILPKISSNWWRKGCKKTLSWNLFLCICDHNLLYHLHLVLWTWREK